MYICTYVCTYVCMYVCVYVYVCITACVNVCTHVLLHIQKEEDTFRNWFSPFAVVTRGQTQATRIVWLALYPPQLAEGVN